MIKFNNFSYEKFNNDSVFKFYSVHLGVPYSPQLLLYGVPGMNPVVSFPYYDLPLIPETVSGTSDSGTAPSVVGTKRDRPDERRKIRSETPLSGFGKSDQ